MSERRNLRTGLLLAVLLVAVSTPGFGGEPMEKTASAVTISTPGEESGPAISGVDCFCWPAANPDSSPREREMEAGGSALVELPRYRKLWVGLVSGARAASWTLDVSSSYNDEDEDWSPVDAWDVDSVIGNRIGSDQGGPWNKRFTAKGPVPAAVYKKLRPADGSTVDQLIVGLNSDPAGKAGCRVVVFAKGSLADE